jgi:addiction module HigA family antidote
MAKRKLDPVHPGEILMEEFLKPMGLSQNQLARDIHVSARRINEIVLGKRALTADTALRLGRYFKMPPKFWLGLQMDYELDVESDRWGGRLEREIAQHRTVARAGDRAGSRRVLVSKSRR